MDTMSRNLPGEIIKSKQVCQSTCNVTLRQVCATMLQWKSNEYYAACVRYCTLRLPACNAHAPYCHLCPAPNCSIFPLYLFIYSMILLSVKYVFRVSLQLLSDTYFVLGRNERDIINNVKWSSCKVPFILIRFSWNLSVLDRFSKNFQVSNFMKIRPVGAEFHADGQTDGQTWRS